MPPPPIRLIVHKRSQVRPVPHVAPEKSDAMAVATSVRTASVLAFPVPFRIRALRIPIPTSPPFPSLDVGSDWPASTATLEKPAVAARPRNVRDVRPRASNASIARLRDPAASMGLVRAPSASASASPIVIAHNDKERRTPITNPSHQNPLRRGRGGTIVVPFIVGVPRKPIPVVIITATRLSGRQFRGDPSMIGMLCLCCAYVPG